MTGRDYGGEVVANNDAVLELLARGGINYTRVWSNWGALSTGASDDWDAFAGVPYLRTGPELAADGGPRLDLDRFDPAHFAEVDRFVASASDRGIVVQLIALDCWHASFGREYGFGAYDYYARGNNVNAVDVADASAWFALDGPAHARNLAYVRELVRVVGHHENLVFETCNEPGIVDPSDPGTVARHPFHQSIAEAIHEEERLRGYARHLVVPVDFPEHRSVAGHRTPTNGLGGEEPLASVGERLSGEQRGWAVPLVSDNDCCPGSPDAEIVRRKAWLCLVAGAHVLMFNNELFRRDIREAADTLTAIRAVGRTADVIRELGIDVAGATPTIPSPGVYALTMTDGSALVALDDGPRFEAAATTDIDAVWVDPRTGAMTPAGRGPRFERPTSADWVLWVPR